MSSSNIRNFSIIAHIDHGKSTLADRLLEQTGLITAGENNKQVLDSMELEKEHGITIKAKVVQLVHKRGNEKYRLNLIDTPGHVDFSYEVSRSLAACEGALLIVDASQGIEAQTMTNIYLALENDLHIIPIINKIDLPAADIEGTKEQIVELLGVDEDEIIAISAKNGIGIEKVLDAIVDRIPAPKQNQEDNNLRALIFDSIYNNFQGVVAIIRVMEGELRMKDVIRMFSNGKEYEITEVGIMKLGYEKKDKLSAGEVGYFTAGIKQIQDVAVGDTVTHSEHPAEKPLPGYKEVKPMVFSGLYPIDTNDYQELKSALEKLKLNDASLITWPESSVALGFGFRCGYLGLLHSEIVQERLRREYGIDLIATIPNVEFEIETSDGQKLVIDNPADYPDPAIIEKTYEPFVDAQIMVLTDFVGNIMKLSQDKRGIFKTMEYPDTRRVIVHYEFPLAEIVLDFYDKLKSVSRGYASLDYEFMEQRASKMVKLDVLVNGEKVDALSMIVHESKAYEWGRKIVDRLRELIPKHMFKVAVQAAIGGKIIARSTIGAMRKNVTAKCYGGDVSRKRKLLEKQKEGKKRMKEVGNVSIPQSAFLSILKFEDE